MCARHAYELMGLKSLVYELIKIMKNEPNKILDYDNCQTARNGGKEVYVKIVSLRTGTFYKADSAGKVAQHTEAHSSVVEVKNEAVQWKFIGLPEEISITCGAGFNLPSKRSGSFSNGWIEYREVSRDHSSPEPRAGSNCHAIVYSEASGGLSQDEGSNLRSGNNRRDL